MTLGPDILLVVMCPRIARRSGMDPTTACCPNAPCPARGQTSPGNMGIHAQKEQRCLCHACPTTFRARPGTLCSRLRTSAETVGRVETWLAPGCPGHAIRSEERRVGKVGG